MKATGDGILGPGLFHYAGSGAASGFEAGPPRAPRALRSADARPTDASLRQAEVQAATQGRFRLDSIPGTARPQGFRPDNEAPLSRGLKCLWLASFEMAGPTGLEPATSGVTGLRSNQLNYDPVSKERPLRADAHYTQARVRRKPPRDSERVADAEAESARVLVRLRGPAGSRTPAGTARPASGSGDRGPAPQRPSARLHVGRTRPDVSPVGEEDEPEAAGERHPPLDVRDQESVSADPGSVLQRLPLDPEVVEREGAVRRPAAGEEALDDRRVEVRQAAGVRRRGAGDERLREPRADPRGEGPALEGAIEREPARTPSGSERPPRPPGRPTSPRAPRR